MTSSPRRLLPVTSLLVVLLATTRLCHGFSIPGFSPVYNPCSPGYSLDHVSSGGTVTLELEGGVTSYDPEQMYQVKLTSSEAFNYVVINGVLMTSQQQSSRGDAVAESRASMTSCALIYTFMSPAPTRTITFYYMSPPSGSGCTLLTVMTSTWNRMVQAEVPVIRLCESPPRISTTFRSLNLNQGVAFHDDFDSGPLQQKWNSDESSIESGSSCGDITSGSALIFCTGSPGTITSHPIDMTSATYLKFTLGRGTCEGDGNEIHVLYRSVGASDWNLLQSVQYHSAAGGSLQQLIEIPAGMRSSQIELRFSSIQQQPQLISIRSRSKQLPVQLRSCVAIDDVIVTTSDQLPVQFYEAFERDDQLNWLWNSNSRASASCAGRDDVIMVHDNGIGDEYLMTRDLDLSGGAGARTPVNDVTPRSASFGGSGSCSHDANDVLVFDLQGKREVCTSMDLTDVAALQFVLSIGNPACSEKAASKFSTGDVDLFYTSGDSRDVIRTFDPNDFRDPTKVLVHLPGRFRTAAGSLCLGQPEAKSRYEDVWAVDSIHVIASADATPSTSQYFAQFSFNLNCDGVELDTRLDFQYSNDLGKTWDTVHSECLPETCFGNHFIYHTVFESSQFSDWTRVSFPLPQAALSSTTRFKWVEISPKKKSTRSWSIDDVFIGSTQSCPGFCSGHGSCASDRCICDDGYTGEACDEPLFQLIDFLSDSFTGNEINQTHFSQVNGAEIGFSCGIVAFGKSLVFNKRGIRSLTTQPIDARELKFLQFAVVMGRNSLTGSCRAPNQPGEGVLVQYSINGGITWKLLEMIPYNFYREPSIVSLQLPEEASKLGLLIRWYQPSRDLADDEGVWSIDDVIVSSKFFKTAYSQSVNFHLGQVQEFCDRFPVLAFTSQPTHGFEARYAETQSLQISSGYVLQADMVIGCHHHDDQLHPDTRVDLQFSTDHGKSWSLVYDLSIPGSTTSSHYHQASVFNANEYHEWSRKTIPLPSNTWSESTRIRLIELGTGNVTDSWSVENVYIGPGCPDMCHNHGYCEHGICTCDAGYSGPTCLPDQALPRGLDVTFDDVTKLKKGGWKIYGGVGVSPSDESAGCSPMTGSNFLHFNQQGVRLVMSPDIDTREGRQIQFYLQIGGGSCRPPTGRGNGVLVQFSTNGGNTWLPVQELYYDEYPRPTFVHLPLPEAAMTSHTRFRWWQPQHGGSDMDEWSIDDVIVGEVMMSDEVVRITSVSSTSPQPQPEAIAAQQQTKQLGGTGNMVSAFLGFSNRGQSHEFCAPRKNALVFNGVKGDRFATTDDVFLTEADVIQYEINVGCTREFSYRSPVRLEFSHDGGMTWDFVRHSCYPRGQHLSLDHDNEHHNDDMTSHVCTGSARTIVESIRHHRGDYDVWTRVTIPVTKAISSKLVRFRWFQEVPAGSSPTPWAIDAVYVGRACPKDCGGHGACVKLPGSTQAKCVCDNGYQETRDGSCQATKAHKGGIWEKFESKHRLPSDEWKRPHGGAISSAQPCGTVHEGNSLLFDGVGTRLAQTKSLDTTNTRLIQFYLRIGSSENTASCSTPTDRNEGIVFQYSTDNGINWNLIREFSFKSHHGETAKLITIKMPYQAQTTSTSFRWWQPLALESDRRAVWALDNIFVGRANMLSNGFYDDFDAYDVSDELGNENWYRVKSGVIDVSQDECSVEERKKVKGHSLILNTDPGDLGFVETWDFYLLSGTFLQFELKASCIDASEDQLRLEYSNDMGRSYQLVSKPCLTDFRAGCDYDTGSVYHASMHRKWTRHTVYLQEQIRTSSVRFRWIRYSTSGSNSSSEWAIDNIYLGNHCEWMCGGHGSCAPSSGGSFTCKCDEGFSTSPHCQPSNPLDTELQETFDSGSPISDNFPTNIGARISDRDVIVSGSNLRVAGPGTRLLDTRPLDTTDTKFIQFNLKFATETANQDHVLVVQSSVNNGITWTSLSEVHPTTATTEEPRFVHIELPAHARYVATNFRFFTPDLNMEANQVSWSIDDLYIGGSVSECPLRGVDDRFDEMTSSNWLFYPGGELGAHCIPPLDEYDEYSDDEDSNVRASSTDPAYQGHSMKFGGSGLRSITTRDMCLCEDSVIQFKLAMGCDLDGMDPVVPAHKGAVRLEVSHDYGASWELVEPHCHGGSTSLDTRCGSERRESSIYYPGSFHNWRTIVIPLKNKKHICSQGTNTVRFRWTQGHVDDPSSVVSWLLDDVYIGTACNASCNGHGICELDPSNEPRCFCDVGYDGDSCDEFIENSNPTFFFETFDPNAFENSEHHAEYGSNLWYQMSGGQITGSERECLPNDVIFSRKKFDMFESGSRSLMTVDVDTSSSTFIQFYMKQDSCSDSACEVNSEPIYLQYTSNGGLYWNNLETFPFDQSPSNNKFHLILLGEDARNAATRFRLWQPSHDGKFQLDWAVDQVVIGRGLDGIDDDFSRNQPDTWIEIRGGKVESTPSCPFDDNHLRLGGLRASEVDCGHRMATTNGVDVGLGSFLQFTLHADCQLPSGAYSCHDISVEYSLDHGVTWNLVKDPCSVDDADCDSNHVGTVYTSDQFDSNGRMNRVVMLLPDSTHSPSTRFRWRLPESVDDVMWTVDDVYVGGDCPSACFGHGNCHNKVCNCDEGWTGKWCQSPLAKLPAEVKDNFDPANSALKRKLYAKLVGAEVDAMCGEIGFGRALHFYKNCSRVLVTAPLDTTDADFVQFLFRYGCYGNRPTSRDHSVMVDYTPNGGAVWLNLAEVYFADFNDRPGFINIFLPAMAKRIGVQFRWTQTKHDGYQHQDWAIDDLHIGGDKRGKYLSDLFVLDDPTPLIGKSPEPETTGYGLYLDRDDKDMWRFYDNTRPTSFCGRDNVVLAGVQPGIEASVGTKDFIATDDYILQYTIVVLCQDIQRVHQPVHVQASTDFGDTWEYVVPQCLPSDGDCFGQEIVQPSAHFISGDWRRRTIRLAAKFIERPVRFRFIQFSSDVQWALDHFYVGPTCPDACLGHGNCVKEGDVSRCVCDVGYAGDNCHLDHQLRTYAKDTFNSDRPIAQLWEIIEAEKVGSNCGELSDGNSLYFDGVGPRQFVTKEFDLQDARFVQYKAVIGAHVSSCLPSKNRGDGLLLQYSSDGGISWKMLLELDYQSYRNVGIDYIPLPLDARTNRTLLRMWQSFIIDRKSGLVQMGFDRAGWAVDDVYIGGSDVNAALIQTHLDAGENPVGNLGKLPDEMFDFHPKGSLDVDQCGVDGRAIWWPNDDPVTSLTDQSLVTRQLIVSKNYLIQFKIRVGCGDVIDECDRKFGIYLEYREDPRSNDWKLVRQDCYPAATPNGRCSLFQNYQSSIYTLNKGGRWHRITIPLDHIESSTTQFRWRQRGAASATYSWSVDDVYIGEACRDFCSGHGDCVAPDVCACDDGYDGPTCANDVIKHHHDFKDNFEVPSQRDIALLAAQFGPDATFPQKWSAVDGGMMGLGGCGSLRPYGYGRTAYFNGCGMRGLTTVEMDMRRAGHIQYVIQIGSNAPGSQTGCRIYQDSGSAVTNSNSSVLLQYSTNFGVTWNLIREHLVRHYTSAKRLSVPLTQQMKTAHTTLRWLQPYHNGAGYDQWAIDNVEIVMTRQNRHLQQKEAASSDVRSRRTSTRRHNRKHR